jgi:tetratricopeptide (TPR) repeat protein
VAFKKAKSDNHPHYEILSLTLFDRWQIEDFLKKQSEYLKAKGIGDWRELQRTIYDTYNLEELARTPVLLEIIIKTISEIRGKVAHINAAKLYQIYTDFWMDREYDDKGDVRWLITRKEKELFVLELAWAMLMTDNLRPEIHFSQLSSRVRSYFKLEKASEIEYFSSDIRFCAYLIHSEADGNYKFIHKSFMEYFSARYIYQTLLEEQNVSRIVTDKPITDEVFFFLSQMIGSNEIDLLQKFSRETEEQRDREVIISLTTRILQQSVSIYERRGAIQPAEEWTNKLLDYSTAVGSDSGRLWSFITLGKLKAQLSQYEEAQDYYIKALNISRQLQDRSSESQSLIQIGTAYQYRGAYDEAASYYERALKIFEEISDKVNIGRTLMNIGAIYQKRLEHEKALSCYERALKIFEEIDNRVSIGHTLMNIGTVHQDYRNHGESLTCHQQALAIFREIGDRRSESEALFNLGLTYRELGRYVESEQFYKEALAISEEIGDRQGASRALAAIGSTCLKMGDYVRAKQCYEQALTISEELGDKQGVATMLASMGAIYLRTASYEEAEAFYQKSSSVLKDLGNIIGIGRNLYSLAQVYSAQGRITEARENYKECLQIFRKVGDTRSVGSVLHQLGLMMQENGAFDQARVYYEEALQTTKQIADVIGTQEVIESLGSLEEAQQNYSEAEKLYSTALESALQIGDRQGECELYAKLGRLAKKTEGKQKAIDYYAKYIKLAREMNLPLIAGIEQEYEQLISEKKYNPFITGMPVLDDVSFGGRSKELFSLYQCIQQHSHVMLIGARRMGKTSLLMQLRRTLESPFIPIFVDMQAFIGQKEQILSGILKRIIDELSTRDLLSKQWETFSITYARDFIDALASILDDAKRKLENIKMVLILDEAERLVEMDSQLAGIIRAALAHNRDVVAILAGTSRLLKSSESTSDSPLNNIFTVMFLGPLTKEETLSIMRESFKRVGISYEPNTLERLYDLTGGIPYYVNIVGYRLIELVNLKSEDIIKDVITTKDIDRIATDVPDERFSHVFMYSLDNLNEPEKEILLGISNNSPQEEFNKDAARDLEAKQIIVKEDGKYRFISQLFKEWYKKSNDINN